MTVFYQVLALKLTALFYLILTAVLWSISVLQMRKWRLGRMNCPRPRARDGRTWIQTHLSEPSGPALSAIYAARGQRGILRTWCLPRSSGGCFWPGLGRKESLSRWSSLIISLKPHFFVTAEKRQSSFTLKVLKRTRYCSVLCEFEQ